MHIELLQNKDNLDLNLQVFKLRNCEFLAIHSIRSGLADKTICNAVILCLSEDSNDPQPQMMNSIFLLNIPYATSHLASRKLHVGTSSSPTA